MYTSVSFCIFQGFANSSNYNDSETSQYYTDIPVTAFPSNITPDGMNFSSLETLFQTVSNALSGSFQADVQQPQGSPLVTLPWVTLPATVPDAFFSDGYSTCIT